MALKLFSDARTQKSILNARTLCAVAVASISISTQFSTSVSAQSTSEPTALQSIDDGITRIGVILYDGVLTSDVTAPMEVFGAAIASEAVEDFEVVTIAPEAGTIRTQEGVSLVADYGINDAPALDAFVVGSSYDMDTLLDNDAFMAFIKQRGEIADWVASNCSGSYVLANAGLLDGLKATTYPGGELWLKINRPSVKVQLGATVVIDGNAITSNGSLVSYPAAFELLEKLGGKEAATEVSELIYYDRLLSRSADITQ
jgi:transcriptional regulator GlxA family with amidase domain